MNRTHLLLMAGLALLFCIIATQGCTRNPFNQGKVLYQAYCGNCHMENGEGLKALIPAINNPERLAEIYDSIPCLIRKGLKGQRIINGVMYNYTMPPNPDLRLADIVNIVNYVNYEWSKGKRFSSEGDVAEALKQCSNK